AAAQTAARDSLTLEVFFQREDASIDFGYMDNDKRIQAFHDAWKHLQRTPDSQVKDVLVTGYASPDGPEGLNRRLSKERAQNLGNFIDNLLKVDPSAIHYNNIVVAGAAKDRQLQRKATVRLAYQTLREAEEVAPPSQPKAEPTVIAEPETVAEPEVKEEPEPVIEPVPVVAAPFAAPAQAPADKSYLFSLRTNLLLPALNVGIEVPLGSHWSVGADWYYPWLWRPKHAQGVDYSGWCVEALGLNLEGRYWFRSHKVNGQRTAPTGHSVGLYAMAGYYDFERNYKGLQGEYATVGVDYLYAIPVFKKKLRLELSLGVGYFYSLARNYEVYSQGGKGYKVKDMAKSIQYFGPTKATVSLVIPIYGKKGGNK
ncbi:MAG: DUF3575 domain-containing protein, partial [Bacteroidales bacterium]|nr:DUF3575 domain-containing protein [Bacteroidales bacterium]